MMKCQLCGYEFDKENLACHVGCPLAQGCAIICCPKCGYQVVDEDRSAMVSALRRLKERLVLWPRSKEMEG